MSLKATLENDLKDALRSADQVELGTLRLVLSALKNKEIETKTELSNDDIIKLLNNQAKQRRDSIAAYRSGGREDLALIEEKELAVLATYLPKEMSETDIESAVLATISELNATSKDFGLVMGATMKKLGPAASGQTVSEIVKRNLK